MNQANEVDPDDAYRYALDKKRFPRYVRNLVCKVDSIVFLEIELLLATHDFVNRLFNYIDRQGFVIKHRQRTMNTDAGRVAALEILVNTPGVANLLRQGKLDQLETAMQSGGATGMQTMDSALTELVENGVISTEEAYRQANNRAKFKNVADNLDDSLEEDAYPIQGQ